MFSQFEITAQLFVQCDFRFVVVVIIFSVDCVFTSSIVCNAFSMIVTVFHGFHCTVVLRSAHCCFFLSLSVVSFSFSMFLHFNYFNFTFVGLQEGNTLMKTLVKQH